MTQGLGFITETTVIESLLQDALTEVARDDSGWKGLFSDPETGDFWLHQYPQGHLHGGGPATLTRRLRTTGITQ